MNLRELGIGVIGTGIFFDVIKSVFGPGGDPGGHSGGHSGGQLRLVGVHDVAAERAQATAEEFGATFHESMADLLASPDVDVVYIATPPYLHLPMMLAALEADKQIICEKPLVMNPAEMDTIMEAASQKPHLKIGCCSTRFTPSPALHQAAKLVREAAIGPITHARLLATLGPIPLDHPMWRNRADQGAGGVSFDWGPYDLDVFRLVFGDLFVPKRVRGRYLVHPRNPEYTEGGFEAEIEVEAGFVINWSRSYEAGPQRQIFEIRSATGGIDLPFYPGAPPLAVLTSYPNERVIPTDESGAPYGPGNWPEMLVHPLIDFVEACLTDRVPMSGLGEERQSHAVYDALLRANRSELWEPVHL